MHELFGQILAYVRGTWRYRWIILLVAWPVAIAGWAYVTQLPNQYQASAQVHVDTDTMLRPLMSGLAVEPNINQRVSMMTRTLLTRPNLEQVARATDMHLDVADELEMDALISRLRRDISIQGAGRGENLYTLSFTSGSPRQAYDVVQATLNLFVEGALGDARADTDLTQRFLDQQIRDYERRLEAAERRLADFRRENVGLLPGDRGDYYQRLQQAQAELQETRLQVREAENRRNEIRRQLAGEEPTFGIMGGAASRSVNPALETRIQNTQTRLDELTLTYTERHPNIISLQRILEDLERQRDEELAALSEMYQFDGAQLEMNPVYQQMRISLSNAQVEASSLRVRLQEQEARVAELQRLVDTVPQVEAELQRLDRDYAVNQENYMALLKRRETAAMSQSIEARGEQVQFRVVEPARVPLAPTAPNRPLLFAGVLLLGFGGGTGLAFVFSQLRPVFDNRRQLNSVTGFPVLGTVALNRSGGQRHRARVEMLAFFAVLALLLLAFFLVVALGGLPIPGMERFSA